MPSRVSRSLSEPSACSFRFQMALALNLAESHLPSLSRPMQLFDPVFTDDDRSLLHRLGCQVIGKEQAALRCFWLKAPPIKGL